MDYTPRQPRYTTKQIAVLHSEAGDAEGLMVDVHETGAKLQTATSFAVDDNISLVFLDYKVDTKVVWQEGTRLGLSFSSPISSDIVAELNETGEGWVIV